MPGHRGFSSPTDIGGELASNTCPILPPFVVLVLWCGDTRICMSDASCAQMGAFPTRSSPAWLAMHSLARAHRCAHTWPSRSIFSVTVRHFEHSMEASLSARAVSVSFRTLVVALRGLQPRPDFDLCHRRDTRGTRGPDAGEDRTSSEANPSRLASLSASASSLLSLRLPARMRSRPVQGKQMTGLGFDSNIVGCLDMVERSKEVHLNHPQTSATPNR